VNTARIVLAALVIFAAGVLTGGVGAGLAGRIVREHPRNNSAPVSVPLAAPPSTGGPSNRTAGALAKPPGNAQLEAMARWSQELNLNPAQRERIESVLKDSQARLRELWVPVAPRARNEIEAARLEIEALLSPDQRARWDEARRRRGGAKPGASSAQSSNPERRLPGPRFWRSRVRFAVGFRLGFLGSRGDLCPAGLPPSVEPF
jgi:hypothetical protein